MLLLMTCLVLCPPSQSWLSEKREDDSALSTILWSMCYEMLSIPSYTTLAQLRFVFSPRWEGFRLSLPKLADKLLFMFRKQQELLALLVPWVHLLILWKHWWTLAMWWEWWKAFSCSSHAWQAFSCQAQQMVGRWGSTLVLPATLQSSNHFLDRGTSTSLGSHYKPKPRICKTAGKGEAGKAGPFGEAESAVFLLEYICWGQF